MADFIELRDYDEPYGLKVNVDFIIKVYLEDGICVIDFNSTSYGSILTKRVTNSYADIKEILRDYDGFIELTFKDSREKFIINTEQIVMFYKDEYGINAIITSKEGDEGEDNYIETMQNTPWLFKLLSDD